MRTSSTGDAIGGIQLKALIGQGTGAAARNVGEKINQEQFALQLNHCFDYGTN